MSWYDLDRQRLMSRRVEVDPHETRIPSHTTISPGYRPMRLRPLGPREKGARFLGRAAPRCGDGWIEMAEWRLACNGVDPRAGRTRHRHPQATSYWNRSLEFLAILATNGAGGFLQTGHADTIGQGREVQFRPTHRHGTGRARDGGKAWPCGRRRAGGRGVSTVESNRIGGPRCSDRSGNDEVGGTEWPARQKRTSSSPL